MSRLQRGMCHEEDIQNILTKLEEIDNAKKAETVLSLTDSKYNLAVIAYKVNNTVTLRLSTNAWGEEVERGGLDYTLATLPARC